MSNLGGALPLRSGSARAWTAAGVLALTAVISYTDRQVLSLLVDPVRADLHINDTQVSLLLGTAFALIYGIVGLPMGWLADRWSRRNLILIGIAIWSAGTIACGLAQGFAELFAARTVVGVGEAALSPAAIALISDLFPPALRGRAVGLFFTGICVGIGGSFLIGGLVLELVRQGLLAHSPLAQMAPWRLVFFVIGTPSLLWCVAILVLVPEPARGIEVPHDQHSSSAWRAALDGAPVFACVALASLVDNAVGAWLPSLMVRRFGADAGAIGVELGYLLIFAYGGGMLVGGWLADLMATRRGPRGKVELCAMAAFAIVAVAVLFASNNASTVMLAAGLYFAFSAVVTASGLSAILDAVAPQVRGLAMAISFFLNVALGAGLGPTAVILSGRWLFGTAAGLGPPLAFTAAASLAVACAAALWRMSGMRTSHEPA